MNIKDIIESWVRTTKPTPEQLELAFKRKLICEACDKLSEGIMGVKVCGECSCPVLYNDLPIGKLYSNENCPVKKW